MLALNKALVYVLGYNIASGNYSVCFCCCLKWIPGQNDTWICLFNVEVIEWVMSPLYDRTTGMVVENCQITHYICYNMHCLSHFQCIIYCAMSRRIIFVHSTPLQVSKGYCCDIKCEWYIYITSGRSAVWMGKVQWGNSLRWPSNAGALVSESEYHGTSPWQLHAWLKCNILPPCCDEQREWNSKEGEGDLGFMDCSVEIVLHDSAFEWWHCF